MKKNMHGFFLLELSIGITLIILIICLALPSFIMFQTTTVKLELYKLHQLVQWCQQKAMTLNQSITISLNNHGYAVSEGYKEQLSSAVSFGFPPGTYGPPSKPTTALQEPITFEHNQIQFYPDGTMQSGALYLTDTNHSCCYALTIAPGSECCFRMYHYSKKSWHQLNEYT